MEHEMFTAEQRQQVGIGLGQLVELGYIQLNPEIKDANPLMYRPGTINVWCLALRDLSPHQIKAGFDILVSTWTMAFNRKPGPGDLRAAINKTSSLDWSEMLAEALAKAYQFISPTYSATKGGLVMPKWSSDALARAVEQMGGPEVFVSVKEDDMNTFRAQFRAVCQNVAERAATPAHLQLAPPKREELVMLPAPAAAPVVDEVKAQARIEQLRTQAAARQPRKSVVIDLNAIADNQARAARIYEAREAGKITEAEAREGLEALRKHVAAQAAEAEKANRPRQKLVLPAEPPQGVGADVLIAGIAGAMAGKRKFG